jgi:hypothetical protein
MGGPYTSYSPWAQGWQPIATWAIPGSLGPHRVDVVSGILGSGKLQVWLDGQLALTMDKPKALNRVVVSPAGTFDGHEVVVYAESADGGVSVSCDLFVDGRSMATGEPLGVIDKRAATVDDRQPAYRNILAQASAGVWTIAVLFVASSASRLLAYRAGWDALVVLVLGSGLVCWPVSRGLDRAFKKGGLSRLRRGALVAAAYVAVLIGCGISLVVAYLIPRAL